MQIYENKNIKLDIKFKVLFCATIYFKTINSLNLKLSFEIIN